LLSKLSLLSNLLSVWLLQLLVNPVPALRGATTFMSRSSRNDRIEWTNELTVPLQQIILNNPTITAAQVRNLPPFCYDPRFVGPAGYRRLNSKLTSLRKNFMVGPAQSTAGLQADSTQCTRSVFQWKYALYDFSALNF
jgi:hypothetical protein